MTKRDKSNKDQPAGDGDAESFASLVKKKGAAKKTKSSFASLVKKGESSESPDSSDSSDEEGKPPTKPKAKRAPTTAGATTRKRARTKSTKTSAKRALTKSGSSKPAAKSAVAKRASTKSGAKSGVATRALTKSGAKTGAKRASTKSGAKSGVATRALTKSGAKTGAKRASTKSGAKTGAKRASTKSGAKSVVAKRASTKSGAKRAAPKSKAGASKTGASKITATKAAKKPFASTSRTVRTEAKAPAVEATSSERVNPGVVPLVEPAPRYETSVVVFENGASNQKRAVDVSQALGYSAIDTRRDVGKLRGLISSPTPPELVVIGLPGGESVVRDVRELCGDALIIATLPGPAESARKRALEVGADLFVVRPHTKDSLAVVLLAAEELLRARRALTAASAKEASLRGQLREVGSEPSTSGFHSLEFFQRVLIMEIKRAKRFGYSLASALIGFEGPKLAEQLSEASSLRIERKLRERVASAVRANIRDIDLPVDYADGRTLLFLPYTDLDGAHEVGRRVAEAVRQFGHAQIDGTDYTCSVSIGISAVRPGNPISFARLMKDAKQALRAAQLKGGGQIVVRR